MKKIPNNRFFLAFIPDQKSLNLLTDLQSSIYFAKGTRLVRQENFHITLLFLGAIDNEILDLIDNLANNIEKAKLESLILDEFIFWKRSKISGVKARKIPEYMLNLHKYFLDSLEIDKENTFTPHVTLAKNAKKMPIFSQSLQPIKLKFDKLYLMQSIFHDNTVSYKVFDSWDIFK